MTVETHSPYLEDIPLEAALARWWSALAEAGLDQPMPGEPVALEDAAGRITAQPVWALISSPHYHAAAMDGYAVRAEEARGATETQPVHLEVGRQAFYVDTGDPLPPGTNAVIMVEDVQLRKSANQQTPAPTGRCGVSKSANSKSAAQQIDESTHGRTTNQQDSDSDSSFSIHHSTIEILAPIAPWQHVRPMGEDMVATELILPANHRLRPQDVGAAAGAGHGRLLVRRRPRVAIQPTGTELVAPGSNLRPGDIVEYNSLVLGAMIDEWGGAPERLPPLADDYATIRARILQATETHDLVIVNAGSSAGSEDFTARIVTELGQLLVHGIAIRPGHPVILGIIDVPAGERGQSSIVNRQSSIVNRRVPIIGLPGYPVSAAITCEQLVRPTLLRWLGQPVDEQPETSATLTRKVTSPEGEEEFLRVTVGQVGDRVVATPLAGGAGVLMSLVRADGIVRIPRGEGGIEPGTTVTVALSRPPAAIRRTIIAIGSHDLTLDLLADELGQRRPGWRLSSANVGSLGGLLALGRSEAHFAGSHLLDEVTGEYNLSYIQRYLPGVPVIVLGFVRRAQGLIVAKGNPKGIHELADLLRPEVSFVNRQRGAGTRVLLDYRLKQAGMDPRAIQGYERHEFTHLAVAAAVASGAVDCGLGILAAARALGLDFVPLDYERYDLIIPARFYEEPVLAPLLDIVRDPAFAARVSTLGGYGTEQMGQVLAVK